VRPHFAQQSRLQLVIFGTERGIVEAREPIGGGFLRWEGALAAVLINHDDASPRPSPAMSFGCGCV
jgi:hypothetical protein